jgi:glucosamine 6-phosphate synthetase-like amidotransferase/phosphosugar isomerase protein
MRTALLTIEDRGRHATGVGWVEDGDHKSIWYSTLEGPASITADRLALPKRGINTAIGHTRHATIGKSSDAFNRHPVVCDNIVLTHNGRCDNALDLIKLSGCTNPGQVDSFALPAMLSRQAELAADHPTDLLELVQGVAALAWIDSDDNGVLHLARLSQRPLSIGWTKRGDLVYGSTAEALRRTARLTGVRISDIEAIDEGTYLRIEEGQVEDMRLFKVNHPPVVVAEDMPGQGHKPWPKAKKQDRIDRQKLVPSAFSGTALDWWDEYDTYEASSKRERDAAFDQAMSDMTDDGLIDGVDWENQVHRRGWKS